MPYQHIITIDKNNTHLKGGTYYETKGRFKNQPIMR
jgi:hypothetical protein